MVQHARRRRLKIFAVVGGLVVLALLCAYSIGSRKSLYAPMAGLGALEIGPEYGSGKGARGGRAAGGMARYTGAPAAATAMEPLESTAAQSSSGGPVAWAATISSQAVSRMVIYTGSLEVRVKEVAKAHEEVARIARAANGYVSESSYNAQSGPSSATISIRVPAAELDRAVDQISKLGKLLDKRMNAQEVSEEYVDLTSRRRNLEREEVRLLELMQRAGRISDLLEVEQTLARVRGEIENISGRLRYLENRVAMSTLTVTLHGPEPVPGSGAPAWMASDVSRRAAASLLNTGRGLATMGIWLAWYAVIWVPLSVLALWLIRRALKAVTTSPPA